MEQEKTIKQTNLEKNRVLWLGMILIIVGTVSFSNYERVGDMLTLVGAVTVLVSCLYKRIH